MKVKSMHGLMVTGAAVALLAGCTGGRGEAPRSAPAPSVSSTTTPPSTPATAAASKVEPVGSTAAPRSPAPGKPARPVIGGVWATPKLECDGHFCVVLGAGTVTFHARVTGATSVSFALASTGTGPDRTRRILGVDRNGRDGWSVLWAYPDQPLLSHLVVTARGPGGTTEALPFGVHHPEPPGPTIGRVWTEPELSCQDVWCTLPSAAGTITIHADVRDALGGVAFFLDPVGGGKSILMGTAVDRGHGYSVTWSYPDAPLRAYVRVSAGNNLGHRSSTPFGFVHS